MPNILIYTFWIPQGTIAQALFPLKDTYNILYVSGDRGLKTLESYILKHKPEYILGLGYYRKGVKQIRSEQVFRNRFGKSNPITVDGKETYSANWQIESSNIKEAFNAGNSRCNQYTYKTLEIINSNKLSSKFAYLHVPKDFNADLLKLAISKILPFTH